MERKTRHYKMWKRLIILFLCIGLVVGMFGGIPGLEFTREIQTEAAPSSYGYVWPTPGVNTISQYYSSSHNGIDIAAPVGSDVVAVKSGTIQYLYFGCHNVSGKYSCSSKCSPNGPYYNGYCNNGVGNGLIIQHDDGTWSEYSHMQLDSFGEGIVVGAHVEQGQFLGKTGSSGYSFGPHLHFVLCNIFYGNYWANSNYINYAVNPLDFMSPENTVIREYTVNIDGNGGKTDGTSFVLQKGGVCELDESMVWKDGHKLIGWNLYRSSDKTWFVPDIGWCTEETIKSNGYTKQLYPVDLYMVLDNSWIYGAENVENNFTFYAVWDTKEYTISLNSSGGSNYQSDFKVKFNEVVKLSSTMVSRTGFELDGWNLYRPADNKWYVENHGWCTEETIETKGLNKKLYSKNAEVKIDSTMIKEAEGIADKFVFKSVWSAKKYTIYYELNGGENHKDNPTSYTIGTTTFELKQPTRKGYKFVGWYEEPTFKTKVTKIEKGSTGDKYLYAKWEEEPVKVALIVLNPTEVTLKCGNTTQLSITIAPTTAIDKSVTWISKDPSIATVDNSGRVTALKSGKTTIVVVANDGSGISAHCEVIVEENVGEEEIKNPFTDIWEGAYYYQPVLWAYANGITAGINATEFGAEVTCTRAQIVTFLWRALGRPSSTGTSNPFVDVPSGSYYEEAVLWAYENGITAGVNATEFGPEDTCTRAQIVTFLWRALDKPEPTTSTNAFTDVPEGMYYTKAVMWAVENGITAGISATQFGPEAACTRGQVVTFLYRVYKK